MFSGIIEEIGIVGTMNSHKNLSVLGVRARKLLKGLKWGGSIAVNGACLTVTEIKKDTLCFDIMRETLATTTLGELKKGDRVNLERALKMNSRVDGHFVTGHVDGVGIVKERITQRNYIELRMNPMKDLTVFIVPKGSICLDGVSLTIGDVTKTYFSVYLIPFTKKFTILGNKERGSRVNIETDILAKYIFNSRGTVHRTPTADFRIIRKMAHAIRH